MILAVLVRLSIILFAQVPADDGKGGILANPVSFAQRSLVPLLTRTYVGLHQRVRSEERQGSLGYQCDSKFPRLILALHRKVHRMCGCRSFDRMDRSSIRFCHFGSRVGYRNHW